MVWKITYLEAYPDKAQYRPGDFGNIIVEIEGTADCDVQVVADFKYLHRIHWQAKAVQCILKDTLTRITIPFQAPNVGWEGYGIDLKVMVEEQVVAEASTAFDVADHWRRAPRYGFLSDFKSKELGLQADVEILNKFHLNVIQFYDWMYRHDSLIPPTEEFIDPMGRSLSYKVVQEKIQALHEKGMAAMAYGAVYAALADFHAEHPDWALYQRNGKPYNLIDIFYIMDISPGSAWSEKIVAEFRRAIEAGFDGIHMDQYGFPKKAMRKVDGGEEIVDLAECYPVLINKAKKNLQEVNSEVGLIFNNVSNYPVHTTAKANQEAVYIEVWPPVIHLHELKGLINRGRELSGGKQVILAAYLPAFKKNGEDAVLAAENGALLTMASIFASGGYHLLLGEENRLLTEAYYPNYGTLRAEFVGEVRKYYDFIVRFGNLLYDPSQVDLSMTYTGGINTEIIFRGQADFSPNGDLNTVWTIVKQLPDYLIISLINLVGLEDDHWEEGKTQRPQIQTNIQCQVLIEKDVKGVYLASPDYDSIQTIQLPYDVVEHEQGQAVLVNIPVLQIWDMLYIEFEHPVV